MDITLERILSLLPKKDDGKFVRGAKKDFAVSIGYDSGDIVSMWINGSSTSYKNKVHEIADKYNVSPDWLLGVSNVKEKAVTLNSDDLDELSLELVSLIRQLSDQEKQMLLAQLKTLVEMRGQ